MKQIFLVVLFLFFTLVFEASPSSAMYQETTQYPTFEAFVKSEDATSCTLVTDGCNLWNFSAGEKGDPIRLCKLTEDFVYRWSCETPLLDDDDMMHIMTTQEDALDILSTQERADYEALQTNLSETQKTRVSNVVEKYMDAKMNYTFVIQEKYTQKVQALIQKYIDMRTTKDSVYMMLQFVKLEIKIMSQNFPIGGSAPVSGEVYTCATSEYRVYDEDYLIDDMAFQVAEDEIHVSDGTFLLPNFVATQEVSASGIKYVGKNTETQEAYTFWFKADEMSVYKGETLLHTCMKK